MKRLIVLLAGLPLLLAACGPGDSGSLGPGPTGVPGSATPTPAPPTPATGQPSTLDPTATPQPDRSITIQVWFTRSSRVFNTVRTKPATVTTSRLALTELIAGPTSVEAGLGVSNAIPSNTTFDIKGISGGVATVSFSAGFYAGGRDIARLRQAQVVYTLTQFATVSRVGFLLDGEATGWPLGRADYADLLPRIVVMSPVIGQRVSSPVAVNGIADVKEATVSVRILDATGKEIATRFTTATCSTGCHGDYSMSVPYKGCVEQRGIVEVYEVSGVDGSRVSSVEIPVTLAGC